MLMKILSFMDKCFGKLISVKKHIFEMVIKLTFGDVESFGVLAMMQRTTILSVYGRR